MKLKGKNVKCEWCGKTVYRRPSILKRANVFYCDKKCAGKQRSKNQKGKPTWNKGLRGCQLAWNKGLPGLSMENHPHWKGGVSSMTNGYLIKRIPGKYILAHRFIMETHLGRKLKKKECVHHIDGDRKNNQLDNLMLFPNNSEHIKYHHKKYNG